MWDAVDDYYCGTREVGKRGWSEETSPRILIRGGEIEDEVKCRKMALLLNFKWAMWAFFFLQDGRRPGELEPNRRDYLYFKGL